MIMIKYWKMGKDIKALYGSITWANYVKYKHRFDEWILCAAIWYKEVESEKRLAKGFYLPTNCHSGIVVCAHRHGQCIYTMAFLTGLRSVENATDGVGDNEQGFLTSKNRFVSREEAFEIAKRQNQLNDRARGKSKTLFSEDLY